MSSDPLRPGPSVRHASSALRREIDTAVGSGYDTPFQRLDLLLTRREARCGCGDCAAFVRARRREILGSLPVG